MGDGRSRRRRPPRDTNQTDRPRPTEHTTPYTHNRVGKETSPSRYDHTQANHREVHHVVDPPHTPSAPNANTPSSQSQSSNSKKAQHHSTAQGEITTTQLQVDSNRTKPQAPPPADGHAPHAQPVDIDASGNTTVGPPAHAKAAVPHLLLSAPVEPKLLAAPPSVPLLTHTGPTHESHSSPPNANTKGVSLPAPSNTASLSIAPEPVLTHTAIEFPSTHAPKEAIQSYTVRIKGMRDGQPREAHITIQFAKINTHDGSIPPLAVGTLPRRSYASVVDAAARKAINSTQIGRSNMNPPTAKPNTIQTPATHTVGGDGTIQVRRVDIIDGGLLSGSHPAGAHSLPHAASNPSANGHRPAAPIGTSKPPDAIPPSHTAGGGAPPHDSIWTKVKHSSLGKDAAMFMIDEFINFAASSERDWTLNALGRDIKQRVSSTDFALGGVESVLPALVGAFTPSPLVSGVGPAIRVLRAIADSDGGKVVDASLGVGASIGLSAMTGRMVDVQLNMASENRSHGNGWEMGQRGAKVTDAATGINAGMHMQTLDTHAQSSTVLTRPLYMSSTDLHSMPGDAISQSFTTGDSSQITVLGGGGVLTSNLDTHYSTLSVSFGWLSSASVGVGIGVRDETNRSSWSTVEVDAKGNLTGRIIEHERVETNHDKVTIAQAKLADHMAVNAKQIPATQADRHIEHTIRMSDRSPIDDTTRAAMAVTINDSNGFKGTGSVATIDSARTRVFAQDFIGSQQVSNSTRDAGQYRSYAAVVAQSSASGAGTIQHSEKGNYSSTVKMGTVNNGGVAGAPQSSRSFHDAAFERSAAFTRTVVNSDGIDITTHHTRSEVGTARGDDHYRLEQLTSAEGTIVQQRADGTDLRVDRSDVTLLYASADGQSVLSKSNTTSNVKQRKTDYKEKFTYDEHAQAAIDQNHPDAPVDSHMQRRSTTHELGGYTRSDNKTIRSCMDGTATNTHIDRTERGTYVDLVETSQLDHQVSMQPQQLQVDQPMGDGSTASGAEKLLLQSIAASAKSASAAVDAPPAGSAMQSQIFTPGQNRDSHGSFTETRTTTGTTTININGQSHHATLQRTEHHENGRVDRVTVGGVQASLHEQSHYTGTESTHFDSRKPVVTTDGHYDIDPFDPPPPLSDELSGDATLKSPATPPDPIGRDSAGAGSGGGSGSAQPKRTAFNQSGNSEFWQENYSTFDRKKEFTGDRTRDQYGAGQPVQRVDEEYATITDTQHTVTNDSKLLGLVKDRTDDTLMTSKKEHVKRTVSEDANGVILSSHEQVIDAAFLSGALVREQDHANPFFLTHTEQTMVVDASGRIIATMPAESTWQLSAHTIEAGRAAGMTTGTAIISNIFSTSAGQQSIAAIANRAAWSGGQSFVQSLARDQFVPLFKSSPVGDFAVATIVDMGFDAIHGDWAAMRKNAFESTTSFLVNQVIDRYGDWIGLTQPISLTQTRSFANGDLFGTGIEWADVKRTNAQVNMKGMQAGMHWEESVTQYTRDGWDITRKQAGLGAHVGIAGIGNLSIGIMSGYESSDWRTRTQHHAEYGNEVVSERWERSFQGQIVSRATIGDRQSMIDSPSILGLDSAWRSTEIITRYYQKEDGTPYAVRNNLKFKYLADDAAQQGWDDTGTGHTNKQPWLIDRGEMGSARAQFQQGNTAMPVASGDARAPVTTLAEAYTLVAPSHGALADARASSIKCGVQEIVHARMEQNKKQSEVFGLHREDGNKSYDVGTRVETVSDAPHSDELINGELVSRSTGHNLVIDFQDLRKEKIIKRCLGIKYDAKTKWYEVGERRTETLKSRTDFSYQVKSRADGSDYYDHFTVGGADGVRDESSKTTTTTRDQGRHKLIDSERVTDLQRGGVTTKEEHRMVGYQTKETKHDEYKGKETRTIPTIPAAGSDTKPAAPAEYAVTHNRTEWTYSQFNDLTDEISIDATGHTTSNHYADGTKREMQLLSKSFDDYKVITNEDPTQVLRSHNHLSDSALQQLDPSLSNSSIVRIDGVDEYAHVESTQGQEVFTRNEHGMEVSCGTSQNSKTTAHGTFLLTTKSDTTLIDENQALAGHGAVAPVADGVKETFMQGLLEIAKPFMSEQQRLDADSAASLSYSRTHDDQIGGSVSYTLNESSHATGDLAKATSVDAAGQAISESSSHSYDPATQDVSLKKEFDRTIDDDVYTAGLTADGRKAGFISAKFTQIDDHTTLTESVVAITNRTVTITNSKADGDQNTTNTGAGAETAPTPSQADGQTGTQTQPASAPDSSSSPSGTDSAPVPTQTTSCTRYTQGVSVLSRVSQSASAAKTSSTVLGGVMFAEVTTATHEEHRSFVESVTLENGDPKGDVQRTDSALLRTSDVTRTEKPSEGMLGFLTDDITTTTATQEYQQNDAGETVTKGEAVTKQVNTQQLSLAGAAGVSALAGGLTSLAVKANANGMGSIDRFDLGTVGVSTTESVGIGMASQISRNSRLTGNAYMQAAVVISAGAATIIARKAKKRLIQKQQAAIRREQEEKQKEREKEKEQEKDKNADKDGKNGDAHGGSSSQVDDSSEAKSSVTDSSQSSNAQPDVQDDSPNAGSNSTWSDIVDAGCAMARVFSTGSKFGGRVNAALTAVSVALDASRSIKQWKSGEQDHRGEMIMPTHQMAQDVTTAVVVGGSSAAAGLVVSSLTASVAATSLSASILCVAGTGIAIALFGMGVAYGVKSAFGYFRRRTLAKELDKLYAALNAELAAITSEQQAKGVKVASYKDLHAGSNAKAVSRAFRLVSRYVHPDKVPESERASADDRFKRILELFQSIARKRHELHGPNGPTHGELNTQQKQSHFWRIFGDVCTYARGLWRGDKQKPADVAHAHPTPPPDILLKELDRVEKSTAVDQMD